MLARWWHMLIGVSNRLYIDTVNRFVPFHMDPRANHDVWLLGVLYDPTAPDGAAQIERELVDHLRSIPYLTYRHGFTYGLTDGVGEVTSLRSDAGWGCTLRSTQMMTSNGIQTLVLGNDWRRSDGTHNELKLLRGIAHLFRDSPDAPLGIHQITQRGLRIEGAKKRIGEWLGPATVGTAMVEAATQGLSGDGWGYRIAEKIGFTVVRDAMVFRSRIQEQLDQHPAGVIMYIPLVMGGGVGAFHLRLKHHLLSLFRDPSFLGFVGGELLSQSFYFVGASEDFLLYLDPHHSRASMETTNELSAVMPPQAQVLRMPWSALNPSATLGFAIKSMDAFDQVFHIHDDQGAGDLFQVFAQPPNWVLGNERDEERERERKMWGAKEKVSEEDDVFDLGDSTLDDMVVGGDVRRGGARYVETGMETIEDEPDMIGINMSDTWEDSV